MKRRRTSTDSWAETATEQQQVLKPGQLVPTPTGGMTVLEPGTKTDGTWETFSFAESTLGLADLTQCDVDGEILRAAELVSGDRTVYIVPSPDTERALIQKRFAEAGKKLNLRAWAVRAQAGKPPAGDTDTALFGPHLYFSKQLASQILATPTRRSRPKQRLPVDVKSTIEIHVSAAEAVGLITGTLTLAAVPATPV